MSEEVVSTPFGKFLVNPNDCVGTTLKAGTLWDGPGFLQVIAREYGRFGERGTTILDLGANIGSFSIYCASQGAWRVLAVEPVPSTMQRLKANLDLNKGICAEVIIPLEVAAYDRETSLVIDAYDPDNMGGTALTRLEGRVIEPAHKVQATPIDQFQWLMGDAVSLVKIDCQGCDGAAIVGLGHTLRRYRPAVVFEWEAELAAHHGIGIEELIGLFGYMDYEVNPWPSQPNNFLAIPE
jgi:FkbM family methyltransferase